MFWLSTYWTAVLGLAENSTFQKLQSRSYDQCCTKQWIVSIRVEWIWPQSDCSYCWTKVEKRGFACSIPWTVFRSRVDHKQFADFWYCFLDCCCTGLQPSWHQGVESVVNFLFPQLLSNIDLMGFVHIALTFWDESEMWVGTSGGNTRWWKTRIACHIRCWCKLGVNCAFATTSGGITKRKQKPSISSCQPSIYSWIISRLGPGSWYICYISTEFWWVSTWMH